MCCGRKSGEKRSSRASARSQQTNGSAIRTGERLPGGHRRLLQDNVTVIFAGKYQDCTDCKLYRAMRNEKGAGFKTSLVLLKKPKVLQEKTAALLDRRHLHLIE